MLYSTSHLRTRFWVAAVATASMLMMYAVALTQFAAPVWPINISMGMLLFSASVFTLYNLYGLEHEERMNFLMTLRHQRMQSELKKANRLLERVSRVDALTQVANRRHFDQFLSHVWERAKRDNASVTVLMVDVDCFKAYNDHFGHPKGDQCLIAVAKAIYNSLRKPGDLLARYGGEEFIAVLSKADSAQGRMAGERVKQAVYALALEHPQSTVDTRVTVSVGVATLHAGAMQANAQTLVAMADEALYQAKNAGRNQVVTRPSEERS
jgi:diguanylate cyclase (GGDEF)-like protein